MAATSHNNVPFLALVCMNQIDETGLMASSGRVMEKLDQEQPLKCPRCDSSNTKFCYYNNYSLSQPRHFCKDCKRYWTRGGILRNVPVGGGCRKNKRLKKPAASTDPTPTPPPPQIDVSAASNYSNPLFYGLPNNPSDINLPFPMYNSRTSNVEMVPTSCTRYNLQPQLNAQGLGFSSATMTSDAQEDGYRTGFDHIPQIEDVVTSNSLLSNYSFFGSSSFTSTSPTRGSLIASSLQQQKLILGDLKETQSASQFQALLPFGDQQMVRNGDAGMVMGDVKMEGRNNRMSNNMDCNVPCKNPIEPVASSDPSIYWNASIVNFMAKTWWNSASKLDGIGVWIGAIMSVANTTTCHFFYKVEKTVCSVRNLDPLRLIDSSIIIINYTVLNGFLKKGFIKKLGAFLGLATQPVDEVLRVEPNRFKCGNSDGGRRAGMNIWGLPQMAIQLFVDGSSKEEGRIAGVGGIAHDHRGCILGGFGQALRGGSPLVAEAVVVRTGIGWALFHGWNQIIILFDALGLVSFINGTTFLVP
ncbi:hypothetical protein HHK36_023628 [Tetracentron sinense]|uniref:Dof zinc finger protein n=1 Tax=Tetracentron sinense TaxID=13715 RepID=A0A835D8V0_TETSI|nr:hypothetical protein HHK36_023628 [Tetracentron sinense]